MPKITDEELETKLVKLFKTDLDFLRTLYTGNFGVNRAIRNIVRAYVTHARAKADAEINSSETETESVS